MLKPIPTFTDLLFYPDPHHQETRYKHLISTFADTYGAAPAFVARLPGRVNLIGEHIDYCGFAVLPLAIDVDVLVAVRATELHSVQIANLDPEFPARELVLPTTPGEFVTIDASVSDWSNYFLCGLVVAHKLVAERKPDAVLKGMQVLVTGLVPTGGGLLLLAAFTCAVALAVLRTNGITASREELARITIVAEHYVGVGTGGMDQTALVCSERHHALYVEFAPKLKATPVSFPKLNPPLVFLIADTMVVLNKHETAPTNYNLRLVEVLVAARLLAKALDVEIPPNGNLQTGTLRGLMDALYPQPWDGTAAEGKLRLEHMLGLVEKHVKKEGYTTQEAAAAVGLLEDDFALVFLLQFPVRYAKLELYKRAYHVYSELMRVLQALDTLQHPGSSEEFYARFGKLMDELQESCDKLYNISCPETDAVCAIAREAGAAGLRVTGAGWGGCTVHLVESSKVEAVMQALVEKYYSRRFPNLTPLKWSDAMVLSEPAEGSSVYVVEA